MKTKLTRRRFIKYGMIGSAGLMLLDQPHRAIASSRLQSIRKALPTLSDEIQVRLLVSRPDVVALTSADRAKRIQDTFMPALEIVNDLYSSAGIKFVYNYERDTEFDSQIESIPDEDPQLQQRAVLYRGKVVIYYRSHGGNAGSAEDYFHLETIDAFNMAHELGHFFNLNHTFFWGRKISDLPELIREGVEEHPIAKKALDEISQMLSSGIPLHGNINLDKVEAIGTAVLNREMDGDSVARNGGEFAVEDTPAALHVLPLEPELPPNFVYCDATFPITVKFSNGYTHIYQFKPDQLNIMGYGDYGRCTPRYFSRDQIQVIRFSLERGNRRHLLVVQPAIKWTGWNEVQGNGTTNAAPAATAFGNRLYIFAKGLNDDRIFVNSASDGQPFGKWGEVQGSGKTNVSPAATAFGNRLYVCAKGLNDNRIYVNSAINGQPFGSWGEVQGNGKTNVAPAATALGNRFYIFAKGFNDNRVYVNSAVDGQPFGKWSEVQGSGTTNVAPATATFGNHLYVFTKGLNDDRIYVNSALEGQPFGKWSEVQGGMSTNVSVAAIAFGNRLYVFAKGKDNRIYLNTAAQGEGFKDWIEVPGRGTTNVAPVVAVLGKRLYLASKGANDNRIYVNSAEII